MANYDEHVPVLIVGGGYAGLASSLFLSDNGVRSLLVDRHPGVSIQGRARSINPRTMEIYRPLGLQASIEAAAAPFAGDAGIVRCETLSGAWEWLFDPEPDPAAAALSPASYCLADQNTVEPILMAAARQRGAEQRFNTELTAISTDAAGATAIIKNRASGEHRTIRADYLIAADGHRSPIREQVGITRTGPGITQHWISIVFDADLSDIIIRRALFWIVLNAQLGFAGFATTATPGRWAVGVAYDPATHSPADFTTERCVAVVRAAVGKVDLPVEIVDVGAWEQAVAVADRFRSGRVFLVGDSAHVWPPAGAYGANSGVQDAHNLAWKLASVVKGIADDSLLDTYEAERRPVALTLGELVVRRQAARFGGGQEEDIDDAICTLGQRYRSTAILGTVPAIPFDTAVSTRLEVGARAPHLWLGRDGARISVHDLFHDTFVLLTGTAGQHWIDASTELTRQTGVPLIAYRIGGATDGADLIDLSGEWGWRGVEPHAAALIRPDGYVAWLSPPSSDAAVRQLGTALHDLLRSRIS